MSLCLRYIDVINNVIYGDFLGIPCTNILKTHITFSVPESNHDRLISRHLILSFVFECIIQISHANVH